ncbi:MAG: hypothetical protein K0R53_1540 [Burkholderiales bacterium]|nr:hypothetical protein [Burkholderiales bacterium]
MLELAGLFLIAAIAWFWFDGLARRESAVDAARRACVAEGVQLLDDTVALASLWPRRVESGTLQLQRIYRFEFSDTGNNRLEGSVTLIGSTVQSLYLEPHRGEAIEMRRLH